MRNIWIFTTVLILFLGVSTSKVNAQISSSDVAISVRVDDDSSGGDIICSYPDGNKRCKVAYDSSMLAVVTDNPALSLTDSEIELSKLLTTKGATAVKVSTVNGEIKEGDFLTTSEKPGVAQKADRNGYVLGRALEGFQSDSPDNIGQIQVFVNIHPSVSLSGSRGNLLQFIREGISVPIFEPLESLRYLLAFLIVLLSFALGLIYFGRSSKAGIEAIGRNPLAKRTIQITILTNTLLTFFIVMVGLGIAYLILVL